MFNGAAGVHGVHNVIHYMVKCWRCYTFYYSCKQRNVLHGSKNYGFRTEILLYIMYNISEFLRVPASNKMYEGAAGVHFIFAGTSKKSEM